MKRTALIVLAVVAVTTAGAFAQTASKPAPQKPSPAAVGPNFFDANGDGVCDNFAALAGRQGRGLGHGPGARMGPGAGRGLGRGMGAGRGMGGGFGAGLAFGPNGASLVDVTSRVTGIAPTDVLSALRGGRTFAQIAGDHGRSAQDLAQAATAARQALLARAVGDGRLTQEQADRIMEQMRLRLDQCLTSTWEPRGQGRGLQGRCPMAGGLPAAPVK